MRWVASLAFLVFLPWWMPALPARAEVLKVATWNLDWLTERPTGDPALPQDVVARAPEDFDRLAAYAARLDADLVALEEVDGPAVAARLFPPGRYAVHMTGDGVVQRVGLAIRRGIRFTANPDVTGLDPYPEAPLRLRSGADVTLLLGGGTLRVLAVHLKTGCAQGPLTGRRRACETLRAQVPALQAWIAARRAEGVPFLVLGDFNRVMTPDDELLTDLDDAAPLLDVTAGRGNPCWGGSDFIDHILAGGPARGWVLADSLRVLVYRETDPAWRDRLSDHCPVSVRIAVPGG